MNCSLCYECLKTVVHLFWHCPLVQNFWGKMKHFKFPVIKTKSVFTIENIDESFVLLWRNVLFGLLENDIQRRCHMMYVINLIIIMAKFHIHICIYTGGKKNMLPCLAMSSNNTFI